MFSTTSLVLLPVVPLTMTLLIILSTLATSVTSSIPNSLSSTNSKGLFIQTSSSSSSLLVEDRTLALPLWIESTAPIVVQERLPNFAWGHVTKYSRLLCNKNMVVKGPLVLDFKYPEIDNTNSFAIIGIQVIANDDVAAYKDLDTTGRATGNSDLQVFPVEGGIGYNSTTIRFSLKSEREVNYVLTIHGVDV